MTRTRSHAGPPIQRLISLLAGACIAGAGADCAHMPEIKPERLNFDAVMKIDGADRFHLRSSDDRIVIDGRELVTEGRITYGFGRKGFWRLTNDHSYLTGQVEAEESNIKHDLVKAHTETRGNVGRTRVSIIISEDQFQVLFGGLKLGLIRSKIPAPAGVRIYIDNGNKYRLDLRARNRKLLAIRPETALALGLQVIHQYNIARVKFRTDDAPVP